MNGRCGCGRALCVLRMNGRCGRALCVLRMNGRCGCGRALCVLVCRALQAVAFADVAVGGHAVVCVLHAWMCARTAQQRLSCPSPLMSPGKAMWPHAC
eukprot:288161-Chlamydomonas_euryale.AAC.1